MKLAMCIFGLASFACGATVSSPNGRIKFSVEAGERLHFSVTVNGQAVLADSPFALNFKGAPPIARDLAIVHESRRLIDETWSTVWGTSACLRAFAPLCL